MEAKQPFSKIANKFYKSLFTEPKIPIEDDSIGNTVLLMLLDMCGEIADNKFQKFLNIFTFMIENKAKPEQWDFPKTVRQSKSRKKKLCVQIPLGTTIYIILHFKYFLFFFYCFV